MNASTIVNGIDLALLSSKELNTLERIPSFKSFVLDFRTAMASVDVDFSNQTSFRILGRDFSLVEVIRIAQSKFSLQQDNEWNNTEAFPLLAIEKTEAWAILKRVQSGKEAQDQKFPLTADAFRLLLEADLAERVASITA